MNLKESAKCALFDLDADENTQHFLLEWSAYDHQRDLTNLLFVFKLVFNRGLWIYPRL